jgi:pimeloyl-ACP methyl ester carboxylesterase
MDMTKHAAVQRGEVEYEIRGDGGCVLFIHGSVIADSFLPLMAETALANYCLIRYRRRGFAGSSAHEGPCSIERQAADASALLRHLGVRRAHIAGHSYGAIIALQLALDAPDLVHSLALCELPLLTVPSGQELLEAMAPAFERYKSGDAVGAVDAFFQIVGGPEWHKDVARTVPDGPEQAAGAAKTFFEIEMPALGDWRFDANIAAQISQPALCVLGSRSLPFYGEGAQLFRSWLPKTELRMVQGVNHLLQMQDPKGVAAALARFFANNPLERQDGVTATTSGPGDVAERRITV